MKKEIVLIIDCLTTLGPTTFSMTIYVIMFMDGCVLLQLF